MPIHPPPGTRKPQVDHSKKLLLLINPNSGPGRALQTYRKQVSTLLAEAEVSHEVLVTERANHATDVVRNLDLTRYAGLVIISGDGLLYEVSCSSCHVLPSTSLVFHCSFFVLFSLLPVIASSPIFLCLDSSCLLFLAFLFLALPFHSLCFLACAPSWCAVPYMSSPSLPFPVPRCLALSCCLMPCHPPAFPAPHPPFCLVLSFPLVTVSHWW